MLFCPHTVTQRAHMREIARDTHTRTHKHTHVHFVSVVSGGSPASLDLRWAMNNHMEAFVLVKPAGLVHGGSLGTSLRILLHTDAGCFELWFVVKATCRRNITTAVSIAGCEPWHKSPRTTNNLQQLNSTQRHLLWAKINTIVQDSLLQKEIYPCFLALNGSR